MLMSSAPLVRPALGLEGQLLLGDDQVHAPEHLGQHGVGLDLQVVGPQLDADVAVAEVVGRPQQVER